MVVAELAVLIVPSNVILDRDAPMILTSLRVTSVPKVTFLPRVTLLNWLLFTTSKLSKLALAAPTILPRRRPPCISVFSDNLTSIMIPLLAILPARVPPFSSSPSKLISFSVPSLIILPRSVAPVIVLSFSMVPPSIILSTC